MGNEINISGANIIYEIPILGGIKITETQVNSLLVILMVFIICKVLTAGLKVKPTSKRQIVAEFLVEKARGLVKGNMGEKHLSFTPFVMALLTISALSSLLSLLGLYPPTADLNTILGWSITVFVLLTREKLRGGFVGYLKGYLEPFALFAPLNIISEIATPISMAFRHFGNVVSGVVISALLFWALGNLSSSIVSGAISFPFMQIGIPAVFSLYFDIFSGCLQAFIFSTLTMINIAMANED